MDRRCQTDFFDYLLRQCANRQRPFGKIESQGEMARLFRLESKGCARGGRPRAESKKYACVLFSQLRRFVRLAALRRM